LIEEVKIFQERLIQIMELATNGNSEPNVSSISAG